MAKEEIARESLSTSEVKELCSKFAGGTRPLADHRVLFGGYSGTSIKVTFSDGANAVLKVCHGYSVADAVQQAAVAAHAAAAGFTGVCAPLPLADKASRARLPAAGATASVAPPNEALERARAQAAFARARRSVSALGLPFAPDA